MRAQFIYEKFTEDSDPIKDMGIGMMGKIKKWLITLDEGDINDEGIMMILCAQEGKIDFVKYLLSLRNENNNIDDWKDDALGAAARNGYTNIVKLLLDEGADIHYDDDYALRWAIDNGNTDVVRILQNHIAKENNIKESLNEKFTEDSDPIADMGIGLRKILPKLFKEEGEENEFESSKRYFGTGKYHTEAWIAYLVLEEIVENERYKDIQEAFEEIIEKEFSHHGEYFHSINKISINKIVEILNKFFHLNVVNTFKGKKRSNLLESEEHDNLQYYYHLEKNKEIFHLVLMNNDVCLGYINFWMYKNNDWEAISVAAEHGYGHKMFEAMMNIIYPEWFIPTRNKSITPAVIKTISKFIDRSDIETQKITEDDVCYVEISKENDYWFNRRYRLKEKININFKEVNYKFINRTGIKLFDRMYPWSSNTSII